MDNIMYQQYNNKYLQKFFTNDYDYMPKPKSRNSSNIKNNLNNKLQLNILGNNSVDDKIQYNFNASLRADLLLSFLTKRIKFSPNSVHVSLSDFLLHILYNYFFKFLNYFRIINY